jgi:hypothetical protein
MPLVFPEEFRTQRTLSGGYRLLQPLNGLFRRVCFSMGHAGSTGRITLDVYSKTWWDERADAVTRVVEAVFAEPEEKEKTIATPLKALPGGNGVEWEPFWAPQGVKPDRKSM